MPFTCLQRSIDIDMHRYDVGGVILWLGFLQLHREVDPQRHHLPSLQSAGHAGAADLRAGAYWGLHVRRHQDLRPSALPFVASLIRHYTMVAVAQQCGKGPSLSPSCLFQRTQGSSLRRVCVETTHRRYSASCLHFCFS